MWLSATEGVIHSRSVSDVQSQEVMMGVFYNFKPEVLASPPVAFAVQVTQCILMILVLSA